MKPTKLWVLSVMFGLICYQWGAWSSLPLTCSVTCGRGLRCRARKCLDSFGNVQLSTKRCSNPEDYESKAESCTVCVVHARCPQLPGWSSWGSWSSCQPKYLTNETSSHGCQPGIRIRHRNCNNPPPEPPPFGLPCTGVGSQTSDCSYNCDERPLDALETITKRIQLQVESDHLVGLRQYHNVKRNQVGYANALYDAPVWLEASQLVWTLNGLVYSRGLAARLSRRIQYIGNLNQSHHGTWMCFLVVPAIGPFSKIGNTRIRVTGRYLLAEFQLKVAPTSSTLWQLAEHPVRMNVLRKLSVTLALVCVVLTLFLLLTIWAAKRWISRSLSVDQKKAIIQEIVDNECRLMLTARKRANINKKRLLPLIMQENQRLEYVNRHLTARLLETTVLEEDTEDGGTNAETPLFIKVVNVSFNNFTQALKRFGSTLTSKSSEFAKRLPAHSEASFKLSSKRPKSRFEIDPTDEKLEDLATAARSSSRRRSTLFAKLGRVKRKPQPVTPNKAITELGRTYRQRAFSQTGRISVVSDVSQDSPVRPVDRSQKRKRSVLFSNVPIHEDDVK
ncbi:uncharacterized protein DEA37_0003306 [Paragonimus westermani]|uniref:Uncharacterized protein n=1 Tax=Paragonimus westermani TaxID=34504 RepID=A0A5J4NDV4_9TREM|nr:uncharacterized protein DEA37_0003306 [Paragonimus westermani]